MARKPREIPARCACRWQRDDVKREDVWVPCETHAAAYKEWEKQEPCPECHKRPGYDPKTGIYVRSWNAAEREFQEGHRAGCKRAQLV